MLNFIAGLFIIASVVLGAGVCNDTATFSQFITIIILSAILMGIGVMLANIDYQLSAYKYEMHFKDRRGHNKIRHAIDRKHRNAIMKEMTAWGWKLTFEHYIPKKELLTTTVHASWYDTGSTLYHVYLESTEGFVVRFKVYAKDSQSAINAVADALEKDGYIDMYIHWHGITDSNRNKLTAAGRVYIMLKAIQVVA